MTTYPTEWWADHTEWWAAEEEPQTARAIPIQTLDLSNRRLTHASLKLLPDALTCLDLSRCGLEQASGLQRLPRLELLNVSYNRLTSTIDVRNSTTLKVLYARSNRISNIAGLATIRNLQTLDLECNALASLDALAPLWALKRIAELRLRGNLLPLALYRRQCQVTALRTNGNTNGRTIHPCMRSAESLAGAQLPRWRPLLPQRSFSVESCSRTLFVLAIEHKEHLDLNPHRAQ